MIATSIASTPLMPGREGARTPGVQTGCAQTGAACRSAAGHAAPASSADAEDRWGSLMIAARDGDDRAYDALLRELSTWLMRYFRRRLAPSTSDDAMQEVLLAVHARRYSYEAKGAFGPWVASIARHKWADCLRRHYRDAAFDAEVDLVVESRGAAVRSRIVVDHLLEHLRPAQAAAVRLVKLEGASIREAAAATGQSPSLVKVNVHRALKKLSGIVAEMEAA